MFNYTRNMQLALTDKLRRAGMAGVAGLMFLVGAGFLIAALWVWLADHLGWGAMGASLTIGGGFLVIGVAILLGAGKERHPTPTTEELKAEVGEQMNLMADAAIAKVTDATNASLNRASQKVTRIMGLAGQKARSAADEVAYQADRYVDRAEAGAYRMARKASEAMDQRSRTDPEGMPDAAPASAPDTAGRLGGVAPLVGAFAVGLTLASRFRKWRQRD